MESKAVGFEQWGKAYGFGLPIPQLFTAGNFAFFSGLYLHSY